MNENNYRFTPVNQLSDIGQTEVSSNQSVFFLVPYMWMQSCSYPFDIFRVTEGLFAVQKGRNL